MKQILFNDEGLVRLGLLELKFDSECTTPVLKIPVESGMAFSLTGIQFIEKTETCHHHKDKASRTTNMITSLTKRY